MTTKPEINNNSEKWASKLMPWADKTFELHSKSSIFKITKDGDNDICEWTFVLGEKSISGAFAMGKTYGDCCLSMSMGIAIELHPFRNAIMTMLNYIRIVAYRERERNSLGELIVRGYIWNVLTQKMPRDSAMQAILHDWHIKDNIDEMYRAHENMKAEQTRTKKISVRKLN